MKTRNTIAAALTFFFVQPAYSQSRSLAVAEQKIIAGSYGRILKDPASAQYHWPMLPTKDASKPEIAYCFQVNAKNSYGAYTGFKLIIGKVRQVGGKVTNFEYAAGNLDDTPELAQTTVDMCRIFGITF